ncbi:MAG: hypothetical protein A2651_01450 [Candidatus Yanofskybacteria bacterium RIFCSPHIGHO2_01_FULL_42_12]|uniref:NAD-dependent epimerase/dehydratase domain-containing protein n=1 Tax=Candidatus Yanofskybacteria bacterium RIFCSPLOWO2_01_FULL_42_49 TaxID=1802694 RepID=A0A1F8GBN7_9BACT|nr:MAG: hypothetical protein A2651_01450 [Candidatus Yanofskybacteria bacterium RIFCSPHIGHO2_01_FULL_42_12]OGN22136.1 MAG: hypothetical protein A2918_03185 [Candidatus Yanofskybacteria bacterium RIFCSPLOWO2_01_FULL_42_49]
MSKTKVLICGANGFIGRNLFEHFNSDDGYETYGTYFKNKPNVFSPRIFQADLRDKDEALRATQGMDIVINAAALTDGMGAFDPTTYIPQNRVINNNLIEAAHINRVKHFIFLSCTVMYPSSERPLKEDEYDLNNVHPKYKEGAQMKLEGECLCLSYANLGITKYTAIRHTNIYGPYDKFDLKRGHVLPATITKVMEAKDKITVWGNEKESRDFLYIDDLAKFIEKAIENQKNNFELFNVGYGKTCSVNKLVQKIIFCSGKKLDVVHDLEKPTVETHMNIDVKKANNVLGWKAEIGLSEGLVITLDWYHNHYPR